MDQAKMHSGRPGLIVAECVANRHPHTRNTREYTCGNTTITPEGTRPITACITSSTAAFWKMTTVGLIKGQNVSNDPRSKKCVNVCRSMYDHPKVCIPLYAKRYNFAIPEGPDFLALLALFSAIVKFDFNNIFMQCNCLSIYYMYLYKLSCEKLRTLSFFTAKLS